MKHAYLIMAHNDPYILERLLKLIDYPDNDIFLHLDKKAKDLKEEEISKWVKKSKLYFVPRMDVRWATNGQINCTLLLLDTATKNDHYAYYHFISGVDLPLKSQKEIHAYFDKHQGKEFVSLFPGFCEGARLDRVKYYHFFINSARSKFRIKRFVYGKIHGLSLKIQRLLKVDRTNNRKYIFGPNWFSITDELARYILSKGETIKEEYKYTFCADELFIQTLIYGTKFYDNLYVKKANEYSACMRYTDWDRGFPYVFRKEDFKILMNSKMIFARKFSSTVDKDIIDMIYKKVIGEK